MSVRKGDAMVRQLRDLRREPLDRWIRATIGDEVVVDSTRALLVWEPRRIVPSYAVPLDDIAADIVPAAPPQAVERDGLLHPGIPFAVHSTDGTLLTLRVAAASREAAAFAPADPDLDGYAVLDFDAFDAWFDEDERLVAHPRDPYHWVEIRRSSRHVRIERDGRLLAESAHPTLAFETSLPTRFYLPRDDVRAEMHRSDRTTTCAYKGQAVYWSFGDGQDIAWSYPSPLPDAARLTDLVAFYDELVDVTVDGVARPRPESVFVATLRDEFGLSARMPLRAGAEGDAP
jgi:uncharacterized protein (DUF427 family)